MHASWFLLLFLVLCLPFPCSFGSGSWCFILPHFRMHLRLFLLLLSLPWSAVPYHTHVYFICGIQCMLGTIALLFVTPKTSFVQVCVSLTDHGWVVYSCGLSSAKPFSHCLLSLCMYSPALHPVSPLLKASAVKPGLYFS